MRWPNLGSPVIDIGAILYSSSLKFKGNPELTCSMQTSTEMTNSLKANLKVFVHCTIYFAIIYLLLIQCKRKPSYCRYQRVMNSRQMTWKDLQIQYDLWFLFARTHLSRSQSVLLICSRVQLKCDQTCGDLTKASRQSITLWAQHTPWHQSH